MLHCKTSSRRLQYVFTKTNVCWVAAYGFGYDSLDFIQSYLSERQQRTKVNNTCSTYSDILCGVPQGSLLGPLLSNIYISDFNLEELIQKLELTTKNLFKWFKNNHMKANANKCHLLVTRDTNITAKIGEFDVKNSRQKKILGVKIDSKLSKIIFFPLQKGKPKVICTRKGHEFYGSSET